MWKPCCWFGRRPLTSATTRTLSPTCVNVTLPVVLLPLVGSSSALARGPCGSRKLWQAATAMTSVAASIPRLTYGPSPRRCACSWRPLCRSLFPGRRRPSPSRRRPCPPRPSFPRRSSAPAAAASPAARPLRRAARPRRGKPAASSSLPLLHVWRARGHSTAGGVPLPGFHFSIPDVVVLLCPRLVGVAVAHVAVRALDADRAHVDVPERRGHVEERRRHVPDPRLLHGVARLVEVREEQDQAAPRHHDRKPEHAGPEPHLLAAVEAARGYVLVLDEEGPRAAQPHPVVALPQVVTRPDHDHHRHRDDEERRDEVMYVLRELREPSKELVADERQQQLLAEEHDETGDAEQAEADRGPPVHRHLQGAEAAQQPAGGRLGKLHRPLPQIEAEDGGNRQHQQPAAVEHHR